jgi:hypothetical protein
VPSSVRRRVVVVRLRKMAKQSANRAGPSGQQCSRREHSRPPVTAVLRDPQPHHTSETPIHTHARRACVKTVCPGLASCLKDGLRPASRSKAHDLNDVHVTPALLHRKHAPPRPPLHPSRVCRFCLLASLCAGHETSCMALALSVVATHV